MQRICKVTYYTKVRVLLNRINGAKEWHVDAKYIYVKMFYKSDDITKKEHKSYYYYKLDA